MGYPVKKIITYSFLMASLTSCSLFFSPDKNELQPKLAGAARTPVNSQQQAMQQQIMAQPQQPQFINNQPSAVANNMGMMDMGMEVPAQPQAEVFINENVAIGTAPAAVPGYQPPFQQQVADVPAQIPAPQPMAQPVPTPNFNYIPQQIASPIDPNAVTVATNQKLPASLRPGYNNPLNYAPVPVATQPVAMPMMQQPMPQQMMMQQMPMGQPMIQPVYNTTQPVDQMQMYTQPMPGGGF